MTRIRGSEIEGFSPPLPPSMTDPPTDWQTTKDLPVEVRAALPAAAQQAFLGAYKKASKVPGLGHAECLQAAWTAVKEAGWHEPVEQWVKGQEPSPGGEHMHDSLGFYPAEVVAKVRHIRAADPTISDTEALCRVMSENPQLYAEYDDRIKHGRAPQRREPIRAREDIRTPDLVACDEQLEELADLTAIERHLPLGSPEAVVAALETPAGRELYAMREALNRGQVETLAEARRFVEQ